MYRITTPTEDILTNLIQKKLVNSINNSPDCTADYFYINSKNKILLLKYNLLNNLYLLNKQNVWEPATSFNTEQHTIYVIPEFIYQLTKYSVKETSSKFESEEESLLEITSVNTSDKPLNDSENSLNEFSKLSPLNKYFLVLNEIYSKFDPNFVYFGYFKDEQKYVLSYENSTWVVNSYLKLSTLTNFVSMSRTVMLNVAKYLNKNKISLEEILTVTDHTLLLSKLNEEN